MDHAGNICLHEFLLHLDSWEPCVLYDSRLSDMSDLVAKDSDSILDRQVRTGRRFGGSVTNRRGDWSWALLKE